MLSYPSGMAVPSRALGMLADALRAHRKQRATRWRKLSAGRQALLVVAYLRKGETYADLGCGFQIGASTVYRYAEIPAVADTAYYGASPTVAVPQRRRLDPDTGRYRRPSRSQKQVNTAHARRRRPGERVNAELKNWRILRKIRSSPSRAAELIAAVQTLMIASC